MGRYARLAAAALALSLAGCDYVQTQLQLAGVLQGVPPLPVQLVCNGDFGQFANGYIVSRPMVLHFAVDWAVPSVTPLDGGFKPAKIIALTPLELSFEVQYEGYRVAYHFDRINGTFSQRPNLFGQGANQGGVYFGSCEIKPLDAKF
jgi:hypothetical protein